MKQLVFTYFSLYSLFAFSQSLDSVHLSYSGQTLSTYIEGELFDSDWPHGIQYPTHRAISSVHYRQQNDTIIMDIYFYPCGVVIQILPYDTLIEKSMVLSPGTKTLVMHSIDSLRPNCSWSGDTGVTKFFPFYVPLSLEENSINTQIRLFPNPGSGLFTLETAKGIAVKGINVKSLSGRAVAVFARPKEVLDLRHLPKGVYLVEVHTEQGIAVKKLLLE